MGKRTEQQDVEIAVDVITLRLLTAAVGTRFQPEAAVEWAAQMLKAVKAKERELGIGIRIDG